MANIKISDLPDAALPLDGPNSFFEVQTIEAGVDVSRKVASDQLTLAAAINIEDEGVPLATGAETLNFVGAGVQATGVGVLKTITIPQSGQVDSVVGGVNITVDATDPINPIANLDAAITGVSVNGVNLSDLGLATNFLDETGAYSVPSGAGGQVDSVVGGTNISVNVADPVNPIVNLDAAITGVSVNGVALSNAGLATDYLNETGAYNSPTNGVVLTSGGVATNYLDETGGYSLPPGSGVLTPWVSDIDGAGFTLEDAGYLFLSGQSAALPDVTGQGQIWVEQGAAGDPLWAEVELLADMDGADGATSYTEISVNTANATFFGTAELDTAQFNSGVSSLLLDGNSDWITFPDIAAYDLGTLSWTIEGFVRFNTLPPLQASSGPGFVLYDSLKGGSAYVQYGIIQDAFGFRVRLVGQDWGAEVGTISGGISTGVWYHWAVTRDVGGDNNIRAYFNGLYEVADFGVSPADLGNPDEPIIIGCRDSTDAFMDGWIDDVRMTVGTARYTGTGAYTPPSTPYLTAPGSQGLFFVDDAGLSTDLLTVGASQTPWLSAIDGDGFDLNDIGVLFMREQAAQEADVSGQMQFWVRDDAFDQSLRVVTGSGIVIPIAAINESDVNDSNIAIPGAAPSWTEVLISQPKENQKYMYQASVQVFSPAADDINIELVIDTLATFSGMVFWEGGGGSGSAGLHSAIGEVITNIVAISTDGGVSPDATYITIIGCLINGNQATTTMSLRLSKQLDTGADAIAYLGAGHSWRAVQST
jgi:hypothetical protein